MKCYMYCGAKAEAWLYIGNVAYAVCFKCFEDLQEAVGKARKVKAIMNYSAW